MRGFGEVPEFPPVPTPGTYAIIIVDAKAAVSSAGNSQIEMDVEVADGKFKDSGFKDWVGTDPGAQYAFLDRPKLRGLLLKTPFNGLTEAGSQNEISDSEIAKALVGQRLYAVIDNRPRKLKDADGKLTKENMTQMNATTGVIETVMNVTVKGYTHHYAGQQTAQAQTFTAPVAQPTQHIAQPQQTQTFAPPQGMAAPAQGGPAYPPNFQPQAAPPPWQAQNGAPPAATEQPTKRNRKLQVTDAQ